MDGETIEKIGEQLRSKISSKFQTTAFLGGFSFTTLGIQLTVLFEERWPRMLPASVGLMMFAMVLYLWGLYRLDSLTMPKMFWEVGQAQRVGATPWELTEGDLWNLKNRMVFYWLWIVLPAVVATTVSLLLMLVPPVQRGDAGPAELTLYSALAGLLAAAGCCGVLGLVETTKCGKWGGTD